MSEHTTPRGRTDEQAVDNLLEDAGLDAADDVRTELLELRALGSAAPLPSDAVRALMVPGPVLITSRITTADAAPADSAPVDELAARRRLKHRGVIAGLAVAVSLAGGASAAAASEGGLPAAFEHLGAAMGSVVSHFTPGSGSNPRQVGPAGTTPDPKPVTDETQPVPVSGQPGTAPATPNSPAGAAHPTPGGEAPPQVPPASQVPSRLDPGNIIPTPPVVPPVTPPDIPKPVPSRLIPGAPVNPTIPAAPSIPAR